MMSVSCYVESEMFSHSYEMNVMNSDLINEQLANLFYSYLACMLSIKEHYTNIRYCISYTKMGSTLVLSYG